VRRLEALTTDDGMLSGRLKALCMTAASAAKRDDVLAARFGDRLRELGGDDEDRRGAAMALLTSRGQGAYACFVRAVGSLPPLHSAADSAREPISASAALAHFREYFGTVPDYVTLLAEHHEAGLIAYATMREAVLEGNPLGLKHAELLLCTVNAVDFVPWLVEVHARGALRAGATIGEVVEAVLCAVPIAGVPAWISGGSAIKAALADASR
jgi:alkylhydroperoxidase/carboxymuconolactone decarboxylase family protein YurZ